MLGDAERPADHAFVGTGIVARDLTDLLGWDARHRFRPLGRVGGHEPLIVREARGRVIDKPLVLQALLDDDVAHGVGQGDVAAHADGQPVVRRLDGEGAARVHHHQACPVVDALEHVQEHDRVRLAGVGAPQEDHVGLLHIHV